MAHQMHISDPSTVIAKTEWETPIGILKAETIFEYNTAILLRDENGIAIVDTWPDFAYHHPRNISPFVQKWGSCWDFRCLVAKINDDIVLPDGAEIGWNDGNESLIVLTECGLATYKNLCKNPKLSGQRCSMVMQKIRPGFLSHTQTYVPDKKNFFAIKNLKSSWWKSQCVDEFKFKICEAGWHLSRGETVVLCENESNCHGWYFWSSFAESKWFVPI